MAQLLKHFIAGHLVEGESGRIANVYNPATGEVTASVPLGSTAEVSKAVAAAKAAFPAWAATSPLRRARVMFKFKELLDQNVDLLAEIISKEHGKVFTDAKGEVQRGMEVV